MRIDLAPHKQELGRRAAADGAALLRAAILARGKANIVVTTGASQFETLAALVQAPGIEWSRVTCFHLDEYVGMPITHPASFRKYLLERFVALLPKSLEAFYAIDAETDPVAECARLSQVIARHPIDVTFLGIGENGHLAFNDPPADFKTGQPYVVVSLDEACRRQQLGEGWFPTLNDVPERAISMSIRQILRSAALVCSVPDERKAAAVAQAVEGPISPDYPASILRLHPQCTLYLDPPAASRLRWLL